jgi:LAO/AO transport system kinase
MSPANKILSGPSAAQRRAIAKAITLLESTRTDHRAQADAILTALLPHTGKSFRLGISGVPGVGKSTFIESLGLELIGKGHRVAVLTIDPSSTVSGGSILGDKTRMERLSVQEQAYIRPSPSSGTLGGVAEKTREAMLVCEAAGYDIVIVETVGVGQSEIAVAGMTDMFVLMQLPNAGDDLQAIKKGVMELADLVVINKADLDPDAATRAQAQITSALRLFGQHGNPGRSPGRPKDARAPSGGSEQSERGGFIDHAHHDKAIWHPQVIQLSALKAQGIDRFWNEVSRFKSVQTDSGEMAARRRHQALSWMWERIEAGLKQAFRQSPEVRRLLPDITADVAHGRLPASTGARRLLNAWHPGLDPAYTQAPEDMDPGSSPG